MSVQSFTIDDRIEGWEARELLAQNDSDLRVCDRFARRARRVERRCVLILRLGEGGIGGGSGSSSRRPLVLLLDEL